MKTQSCNATHALSADSPMYIEGFVFGKFYPLHMGHIAMMQFAGKFCQILNIIVCSSDAEKIPSSVRAAWILEELHSMENFRLVQFEYSESSELPNTSASDSDVSEKWSRVFRKLVPNVTVLVTSEPYGEYVAEFMNIVHVPYDQPRHAFPICATNIRRNVLSHWRFLPSSVRKYFQRKVTISGTESTGAYNVKFTSTISYWSFFFF